MESDIAGLIVSLGLANIDEIGGKRSLEITEKGELALTGLIPLAPDTVLRMIRHMIYSQLDFRTKDAEE